MIERLEQPVEQQERLTRIIGQRQQFSNNLDTGPEDPHSKTLAQARATIIAGRLTQSITRLLPRLGESYSRQLLRKERDLHQVKAAKDSPFSEADIFRFTNEIEEFRQRPAQDPLLARGIELFNRQREEAKQPVVQKPAEVEEIEKRGIRLTSNEKRVMGVFLSHVDEEHSIASSELIAKLWPAASRIGGLRCLRTALYKWRKKLTADTGLSIINLVPKGANKEGSYYLKVDPWPISVLPEPPPEDIFWMKLISPMRDYRRLSPRVLRKMRGASTETKQFLEDFLRSEDAHPILNCIFRFSRARRFNENEEEDSMFYRNSSGYLTEWLVYKYLYPKYLEEGLTLLSPHQKLIVYMNAYPEKEVVENNFGTNPEIKGVPSPDSLLIKPVPEVAPQHLEIVSVVECKNVTSNSPEIREYISRQLAGYTHEKVASHLRLNDPNYPELPARWGRLIHKLIPQLPALPLTVSPQLTVVYAVPIGSPSLQIEHQSLEEIPISTNQIGVLIRRLSEVLK